MVVEPVGGQPEQKSSSVAVINKKSVAGDINSAKAEEPVREKHDTNGSSPVKRKQVSEESDSESEDHASPTKKPRSEAASRFSDEEHADLSDEDIDKSVKTSPEKQRQKRQHYAELDEDEELGRMYDTTFYPCDVLCQCSISKVQDRCIISVKDE